CGYNADIWKSVLRVDPDEFLADAATQLAPDATSMILLPTRLHPHREAESRPPSSDPSPPPDILMNYYDDPHDLAVMVAGIRRCLEIVANWPPGRTIGPLLVPPAP